ncbi:type IV secretion system protein VirD4 domain protein [Wolbachia pipientis wUni]|nr:type IV secretion system protein VirD4 domain protein [Wolbachia pipientis wUni]
MPTQEPYDPNKVLSAAASKDKVNNEGNNVLEGPNSVDYPAETKTEDAVYDESDEFADEDIDDEDIDDKFEDDDEEDEDRSDDGFDDEEEEDEFEDEDKLKNDEK